MASTNYLDSLILAHWVKGAPFSAVPTHVGLFNNSPTKGGELGQEVAAVDYTRKLVSWSDGYTNSIIVEWPMTTVSWGTVRAVGLFNSGTGNYLLAYGNTSATVVSSFTVVRFPVGALGLGMV